MQGFEVQSSARVADDHPMPPVVMTPAQKRGLKYQARVEAALERQFPGVVVPRPWFRYKVCGEVKRCQPDLLLFFSEAQRVLIVEVKYSTMPAAWSQLHTLYAPVVEKAYRLPTSLAMVTRAFDPAIKFPCAVTQLEGFEALSQWKGPELGVVSWK